MNRNFRNNGRRDGVDPITRARARRRALQAVYAWQMSGGEVGAVIEQFAHEQAHEIADLEYFDDLVRGVVRHRATLDVAGLPLHRPDHRRQRAHRTVPWR